MDNHKSVALEKLPSSVKNAVMKLSLEQQSVFEEEYLEERRDPIVYQLLAIFFPIQHFLQGEIGKGLLFICTFGGLGWWWIIEIFIIYSRTKKYNIELAKKNLRDLKIAIS
jgi:hypothetical protein